MPINRHNPSVETQVIILESEIPSDNLISVLCEHTKWTPEVVTHLVKEGGLFINKKRYQESALPHFIPANSRYELFLFTESPDDIPITKEHILYEDDTCLAINKPAWLPVQGTKVSRWFCLEEKVRELTGCPQAMAAHRLDRQTSGVVLFGKDPQKTGWVMKQFSARQVHKIYMAVLDGFLPQEEGTITGFMWRDFKRLPQVYFRISEKEKPKSKASETHYKVIEKKESRTLVRANPITGRTHQLRVHFASLGCPIVGDNLYGGRDYVKAPSVQLHAAEIDFFVKSQREPVKITAPLPSSFIW